MATGQAVTAEEITDSIRALVDRLADAKVTQELARRGADVGARAGDAWRDSEPMRREAVKAIARAGDDAGRWSRASLQPWLRELWKRRAAAIGVAGATLPVGREIVDSAAVRLGLRQREQQEARHWGAFFLGLVLGAVAGIVVAMLTTPKRGSELRQQIGARADDLAARARDEWVPMFERAASEATTDNGHPVDVQAAGADLADAAAEVEAAATEAVEAGAEAAAESVSQAADAVDRETA